jgi:hypothetical protein
MQNNTSKPISHLAALLILCFVLPPVYFSFKNGYGDSLFLEDFCRDVFLDGGRWKAWAWTFSPAFFPDVFIYILGFHLFSNPFDTMFFVAVIQVVLVVCAIFLLGWSVDVKVKGIPLALLALLLAAAIREHSLHSIWLLFNSTNNHFGSYLATLFAFALTIKSIRSPRLQWQLILFILVIIASCSGQLFTLTYTATLIGAGFLFFTLQLIAGSLSIGAMGFWILTVLMTGVATIFGNLLRQAISPNFPTYSFSIERSIHSLSAVLRDTLEMLLYGTIFNYLMFIVTLGAVCTCVVRIIVLSGHLSTPNTIGNTVNKNLPKDMPIFFLYCAGLVAIPVSILGIIWSGGVHNHGNFRYLLAPISLPIISMAFWLSSFMKDGRFIVFADRLLFVSCLGLCGLQAFFLPSQFTRFRSAYITPAEAEKFRNAFEKPLTRLDVINHRFMSDAALVSCLDTHAQEYGLHTGVAEFWDARSVYLLSKTGLAANAFLVDLTPLYQMSSLDHILGGRSKKPPLYNFVITSKRFSTGSNRYLGPDIIRQQLGTEDHAFVCQGAGEQNTILVYNSDDRLDRLIKSRARPFVLKNAFENGLEESIQLTGSELSVLEGVTNGSRVKCNTLEKALCTYGPYLRLATGNYRFKIDYRVLGKIPSQVPGRWDVFTNGKPGVILSGTFDSDTENGTLSTDFSIRNFGQKDRYEIRSFTSKDISLEIISLQITKVS